MSKPKAPKMPAPPPPAPPAQPAPVGGYGDDVARAAADRIEDTKSRRGRKKLRIDLAGISNTGSGGSGVAVA